MKSALYILASCALALTLVFAQSAHAQSAASTYTNTSGAAADSVTTMGTSTTGTMGTTSPGLPNTGLGGDAALNFGLLLSSGLIAVAGTVYALRRYAQ